MEREDHSVEETKEEAEFVNGVDESNFHHVETGIPPTEPEVDMNNFHFEVDAHIDHIRTIGNKMWHTCGVDVIDFDEFDSGEKGGYEQHLTKRNKRKKVTDRVRVLAVESRRETMGLKCDKKKVKTLNDIHKCLQTRDVKVTTSEEVSNTISSNLEIPIRAPQEQLQRKFQINILKMKAYIAKEITMKQVKGNYHHQYDMARDYAMELKERNRDTTVKGILIAIAQLEHKLYVRHNCENIKQLCKGRIFKDLMCKGATTTTMVQFNQEMKELRIVNPKLMSGYKRYHHQHGQAFNSKSVDGRDQPIIGCLEYIREYLMKRTMNVHEDERDEKVIKMMVKDGKLSKKDNTITCGKCGGKGHNKRACTGPTEKQASGKGNKATQKIDEILKADFSSVSSRTSGQSGKVFVIRHGYIRSENVDMNYTKDPNKGRSIIGYAFLVQRCVVRWKATLLHVVVFPLQRQSIWPLRSMWRKLFGRGDSWKSEAEVLKEKMVEVLKVGTEHSAADDLTKVVTPPDGAWTEYVYDGEVATWVEMVVVVEWCCLGGCCGEVVMLVASQSRWWRGDGGDEMKMVVRWCSDDDDNGVEMMTMVWR
nr:hypothetical protein [Tanacetum cinerariifolium]